MSHGPSVPADRGQRRGINREMASQGASRTSDLNGRHRAAQAASASRRRRAEARAGRCGSPGRGGQLMDALIFIVSAAVALILVGIGVALVVAPASIHSLFEVPAARHNAAAALTPDTTPIEFGAPGAPGHLLRWMWAMREIVGNPPAHGWRNYVRLVYGPQFTIGPRTTDALLVGLADRGLLVRAAREPEGFTYLLPDGPLPTFVDAEGVPYGAPRITRANNFGEGQSFLAPPLVIRPLLANTASSRN